MRILLISYYFPPAGGAAVQRWLRFIRYLDLRGVKITVICSAGGDYPFEDKSLLEKIPSSVKVIRSKAPQMQRLWKFIAGSKNPMPQGLIETQKQGLRARLAIFIRLNFIIPDLRVFWNSAAFKAATKELKSAKYDSVITTGPPHSSHLIGMQLKKKYAIRWFTDFRDPWADIHYLKLNPPLAFARFLHRYLEKKVLKTADANFIISAAIAASLPKGTKIVLYNGFDPQDFAQDARQNSPKMRIKYVGQFTAGQNPLLILEFCQKLKRDYELHLVGSRLFDTLHKRFVDELGKAFIHKPFMPHHAAISEMQNSELLLLLLNEYEGNEGMLTTKLFEYLASRSPILCIGNPRVAAAELIQKSNSGRIFDKNELDQAAEWVNNLDTNKRNDSDVSSYRVDKQVDSLLEVLKS